MDASARGQRIARARRRRGLSQAALAGLAGRSESWLSQVERGLRRVDSHSVVVSLAEILHVDVGELTGDEPGDLRASRYAAAREIERAMMAYDALESVIGAAVNMILPAEQTAPQLVRYDTATHDLLALLLRREHRASTPQLRPLAHRAGVI